MDILAHALWTNAAAFPSRRRLRRPLRLGWAVFWGVFPDLFSFAIPAVVRIWWYATGVTSSLRPDANSPQHFQFVWQLYYASHSVVVFTAVFGIVWIFARRPVWELLGWGLHILIDIPTHQGMFALHFLWPLSSFSVSGIRWENKWFLAANYAALLLAYLEALRRGPEISRGSVCVACQSYGFNGKAVPSARSLIEITTSMRSQR